MCAHTRLVAPVDFRQRAIWIAITIKLVCSLALRHADVRTGPDCKLARGERDRRCFVMRAARINDDAQIIAGLSNRLADLCCLFDDAAGAVERDDDRLCVPLGRFLQKRRHKMCIERTAHATTGVPANLPFKRDHRHAGLLGFILRMRRACRDRCQHNARKPSPPPASSVPANAERFEHPHRAPSIDLWGRRPATGSAALCMVVDRPCAARFANVPWVCCV